MVRCKILKYPMFTLPPPPPHKVMLWDFCPYFGEFMVFPLTWSGGVNMGVFQRTTPGSMTIYLE